MPETAPLTMIAARPLPFGEAQIVEWVWPSPMDVKAREHRHMIEMSLPPLATDGTACFPELGADRFSFMGNLFIRPAGVAIRARSAGGRIRVVRLAVEAPQYEMVTGRGIDYSEQALRAGLDLRDERPRMLLHRLRDELLQPGFASALLIEGYGTALLVETARAVATRAERRVDLGRLAGWQYRRVCERIECGPAPSLRELAALCGLSARHFTRLYRALTGENVAAHVARVQVERAARLLEEGDRPLKEIAAELGFAHQSSFSAAFRRATGLSPSRYRQRREVGPT